MNYDLRDLEAEKTCLEEAQANFEHEVARLLIAYAKDNNIPVCKRTIEWEYEIDFEPTIIPFDYGWRGVKLCNASVVKDGEFVELHDELGERYFIDGFTPKEVITIVKHILGIENANKEDELCA